MVVVCLWWVLQYKAKAKVARASCKDPTTISNMFKVGLYCTYLQFSKLEGNSEN